MIERILSRLFKYEPINGHDRCPTYMHRWTLFQPRWARWFWRGFGLYLHKFVADDWTLDLHDHPKRFISIGLSGAYVEWWLDAGRLSRRVYRAPWLRTFPAHHCHRLELLEDRAPCWTFVIVLRTVREWGFRTPLGRWVPWREYVKPGNADAEAGKFCN